MFTTGEDEAIHPRMAARSPPDPTVKMPVLRFDFLLGT